MYDTFCHEPEYVHECEEYKWNGAKEFISPNIALKGKNFIQWMNMKDDIYILHHHFLISLTRGDNLEFRKMDIEPMPNTRSSYSEPPKPMTTFSVYPKPTTISGSQTAFNNFKKCTKRDASAYPIFNKDLYYNTFQRSFSSIIKAQGLYDVADTDYNPDDGDQYDKELFKENNSLFILYWLLPCRQKRGESWSRNLKEMQDPSFQNCTIIILSQILHNMKLSL